MHLQDTEKCRLRGWDQAGRLFCSVLCRVALAAVLIGRLGSSAGGSRPGYTTSGGNKWEMASRHSDAGIVWRASPVAIALGAAVLSDLAGGGRVDDAASAAVGLQSRGALQAFPAPVGALDALIFAAILTARACHARALLVDKQRNVRLIRELWVIRWVGGQVGGWVGGWVAGWVSGGWGGRGRRR